MKEYTITYLNEKCDKMFACLQNSKVDMQNEQEILNRCELLNRMIAESGEYKAVAQCELPTHGRADGMGFMGKRSN